jgi:hypothetical protein
MLDFYLNNMHKNFVLIGVNVDALKTDFVISSSDHLIFKREGTFLPSDWDNLWEQHGNEF